VSAALWGCWAQHRNRFLNQWAYIELVVALALALFDELVRLLRTKANLPA
jgi:hypothetical protein